MHILLIILILKLFLFSAEVERDLKIPKLENIVTFFLHHWEHQVLRFTLQGVIVQTGLTGFNIG